MAEPRIESSKPGGVGQWPWEAIALGVLGTYFLVRLLYFAMGIVPDIPPDESTHVG